MTPRDLFVVLTKVLGLYVLSGHAMSYWVGFFDEHFIGTARSDGNLFSLPLVYALSHTVVGLCLLFGAEHIAEIAGVSHGSSTSDDTEQNREPKDEPTT